MPEFIRGDEREEELAKLRYLGGILRGELLCWIALSNKEADEKIYAVAITQILLDTIDERHALLVRTVASFGRPIPDEVYLEAIASLKKYAANQRCFRIVGYTKSKKILSLLKSQFGRVAESTFCSVSLNGAKEN